MKISKSKKGILIGLAAAAAVVLVIVLIVVLSGGGSGLSGTREHSRDSSFVSFSRTENTMTIDGERYTRR
ncbi:MAG: hypothetical protein FWE74_11115 [Oscillospiraceae bacterium]|nr:hypothetical protein [Oscillospiraceae bacterium]